MGLQATRVVGVGLGLRASSISTRVLSSLLQHIQRAAVEYTPPVGLYESQKTLFPRNIPLRPPTKYYERSYGITRRNSGQLPVLSHHQAILVW